MKNTEITKKAHSHGRVALLRAALTSESMIEIMVKDPILVPVVMNITIEDPKEVEEDRIPVRLCRFFKITPVSSFVLLPWS